jgi:hypothetical protein
VYERQSRELASSLFAPLHGHEDDILAQLGRERAKVELFLARKDFAPDLERDGGRVALDRIADADTF